MSERSGFIPIWFFIGILLFIYGILICATGIYELYVPPEQQVAMAYLRPAIWWGALLILLGGYYCFHFAPSKTRKRATKSENH